tara:strand:- start:1287 stop:2990 length:1704 start_codon:yes stop_codon:yes gene_type:complete
MPFVKHRLPCNVCGGSDPVSVDEDGAGFCFSCRHYFKQYDTSEVQPDTVKDIQKYQHKSESFSQSKCYAAIADRGISKETAKKYGVQVSKAGNGSIVRHYYPYYEGTELSGTKIRKTENKDFAWVGDGKKGDLFGQNLFSKGGKYLTIVEGELDAMAAYQMQGSKYPVVSVKSGSSALKDCKESYEWIDSYENIVVCFDNDDVGIKSALEVAELFGGKTMIVKHQDNYKDACDYLKANQQSLFIKVWWQAERFVPDGIVLSSQLRDEVMADLEMPFCSYPWDCLNLMLYGMRKAELITLTAGTGVGKSTVVKQLQEEIFKHTDEKIGVLSLEESVATAALGLMSLSANKLLHLPTKEQMMKHILKDPNNIYRKPKLANSISQEEKQKAFEDILSGGRFLFLKHVGKFDMDSVLNKIKYLAKAEDCGVIVLDHISILVGMAMGVGSDERKAIDAVMHSLRAVVEETGVSLIAISHLSKASGNRDSHEEGGRVRLGDLRGSNAIAQLSNIAIALEGNRQADDPEERNMTIVRILKNRFSGETGIAGYLKYDSQTGRLNEVDEYDCGEVL